jgi:hypothetical protein
LRRVHPHIQRCVVTEAETPLPLIKLWRRDANIEKHAIDAFRNVDSRQAQGLAQLAEALVHDQQPAILNLSSRPHRLQVAVEGQQATVRPQPFENCPAVSATTKSAINIDSGGLYRQGVNRLPQQNRLMLRR